MAEEEGAQTKVVLYEVEMACGGCSGAVNRILRKIEGVQDVDANIEAQRVTVTCSRDVDDNVLTEALLKWSSASKKRVQYVSTN